MTATKSKITDLLAELDSAFATAEAKRAALAKVHEDAAYAITEAQKDFDAIKAEHAKKVNAATESSQAAQTALDKARAAVDSVFGHTDPRVSVK